MSRKSIFIAFVVSLGGFLFGFDAAIISGAQEFFGPYFGFSGDQIASINAAPTFAAMFSMLIAGLISDKIGRKKVLIAVAFVYALSAFLSAYAISYWVLWWARFIGGAAFGAALILAPMYIAEVSTAKNRGKLVSVQQLNIVIGLSVAYFTGYFLQQSISDVAQVSENLTKQNVWRWMFGLELIPAVIYFFLLFFVPKSPRWLYVKGRDVEAFEVLKKLHGNNKATEEEELIKESFKENSKKEKITISKMFKKSLRFVLFLGLFIGIIQMITGINAIFFYSTSIFKQSGIGTNAAFASSVLVGVINIVFTILAMILIDRMGRRPLMLIGLIGAAIGMFLTSYGFSKATYKLTKEDVSNIQGVDSSKFNKVENILFENDVEFKRALKELLGEQIFADRQGEIIEAAGDLDAILILIGILTFVASFAFSLGPVMWVLLSELFPNRVRSLMIAFVGFVNSCTSWVVQRTFNWEIDTLGSSTSYFIFGALALVGFVVLLKYLPETKGKSLEQIEKELVKA
ncbi:sugar porter family MFS transporter [Aquimarina latercula]|uniref:sugar porter family MFS transporter n=1 Tax=Aquimarina latercula TaxID=987 RepID=UPI000415ED20|nr:sugar porter family MFS transporter [Aquimarina latercula]